MEIASEDPLPSHLKRERKQAVLQQDHTEQLEFDMDKTENKLNQKAQAKAARRDRLKRNSPTQSTTQITRKRERKQIKKTYSRKRTDTQFLRRNPNMPLSYRPAEEIGKFRINARGGDTNEIDYKEKSETFRSLEIAKIEASRLPFYIPKDQLRTDKQREKDDNEKHARSIKTTRDMEKERTLPPIITNPDHPEYEYWKDPADPQWIGKPRTPPADPDPKSYKNPHSDFREVLKNDPRGYDFGFKTLSPDDQKVQLALLASRTSRPSGSSTSSHTSSNDNGSDNEDSAQSGSHEMSDSPDLVTIEAATGRSVDPTC